ncbi:MAG: hydrogenase maturation protease [Limisphaerales bacterium]
MTPTAPNLIVAIGNPTRQDDAAGPLLAHQLQQLHLPQTDITTAHQLTPEMAPDWAQRKNVLVIDANAQSTTTQITEITSTSTPLNPSSHNASPHTIATLAKILYQHAPHTFTCSIPASSFNFSASPSPQTQTHLQHAQTLILHWLQQLT